MTTPYLGDEEFFVDTCTRQVEGGLCGEPATVHIIWPGLFDSNACERHRSVGYDVLQEHAFAPACGHPGNLWVESQATCIIPQSSEDFDIGQVLS